MPPGRPALCLVCQGEGLFGLHQKGLCVCGCRDTDKDQASLTLVQISETCALGLHGHVSASQEVIVIFLSPSFILYFADQLK